DVRGRKQELALQVRQLHTIAIDDTEGTDPCCGEIHGSGRSQAARADDENARVFESFLPGRAELSEREVALIPVAFRGREAHRSRIHRGRNSTSAQRADHMYGLARSHGLRK